MRLKKIICFYFSVLLVIVHVASANGQTDQQTIDFKLRILDNKEYSGIKLGESFYVEISITNNSSTDVAVGDYFRIIMNENQSSWDIMSMGARGETRLKAKDLRYLCYGSGAASLSMAGENGDGIQINFPQSNDVINDGTDSLKNYLKNWPNKIGVNKTMVIKWPTFWFTNTSDSPLYLASPSVGSEKERAFYWVNFKTNKVRRIDANEKSLKSIISDKSESLALRAATARWLMETNLNAQKYLLQFIQKGDIPTTLAYRCIQALVIWGSESTIDDIFSLWKNGKIAPELEKNLAIYLTWSEHENADKAAEKIKAGSR